MEEMFMIMLIVVFIIVKKKGYLLIFKKVNINNNFQIIKNYLAITVKQYVKQDVSQNNVFNNAKIY